MDYSPGKRVSWSASGTIVNETEFDAAMFLAEVDSEVDHDNRNIVHVKLDSGTYMSIDVTEDKYGTQLRTDIPQYWPPQNRDSWLSNSKAWYCYEVDYGNRKGMRMVMYTSLGENVRSIKTFLKENPDAVLRVRGGQLFNEV